jgi:hypothetical protein
MSRAITGIRANQKRRKGSFEIPSATLQNTTSTNIFQAMSVRIKASKDLKRLTEERNAAMQVNKKQESMVWVRV